MDPLHQLHNLTMDLPHNPSPLTVAPNLEVQENYQHPLEYLTEDGLAYLLQHQEVHNPKHHMEMLRQHTLVQVLTKLSLLMVVK